MNNKKKQETIAKRQAEQKESLLGHLRRYPIIQVVCEKSEVSRATYYRWRDENPMFAQAADAAMTEGEEMFNDLAEHQLLSLMKDKHWPSIHYWLNKRHPKFNQTKVQVDGQVEVAFTYDQKH
ncbi:MAG: hypothetical protein HY226_06220 [Candidatus Vogelbacteria bacterium]|nr:hypothetical protein [Candidatus Vogelbacteria bacterium]